MNDIFVRGKEAKSTGIVVITTAVAIDCWKWALSSGLRPGAKRFL